MEPTTNGSLADPTEGSNQFQDRTSNTRSTPRFKAPPNPRSKGSSDSQGSIAPSPDLGVNHTGDEQNSQAHRTANKVASAMLLSEWRGNLTVFGGMHATLPSESFEALSWADFSKKICADEPIVVTDKKYAPYFLPCGLHNAPLTGKTLERAKQNGQPTIGKMRSKDHVTDSRVLLFDYDGITEQDFEQIRSFLEERDLTSVAYTTFSHGMEGKPGMHVRLCIPVDRPLDADAYTAAWCDFAALLNDALDADKAQSDQGEA